jgi:hypothetical protein
MLRLMFASVLLVLASAVMADETTASRTISNVRVDGSTGNRTVYFETATSWSAPGCTTAKYVFVRGIDGLQDLLAVGLAAKLSERSVSFTGTCQSSNYFQAYYINLE